jgi:hypothetical protein
MPLTPEDYISPGSDGEWYAAAIEQWRLDQRTGVNDGNIRFRHWRLAESDPDRLLTLIAALAERAETPEETLSVSETLEALLQHHGETYWKVLNELCRRNHPMRRMMSQVWGANLPKSLKRKVEMWRE